MKELTALIASIAAVASLGVGALHTLESQLLRLVPHVNVPHLTGGVPTFKKTPGPMPEAAKEGSAAKTFGTFVVGRVLPAVGGTVAGNDLANRYGDDLNNAANEVLPGNDVGGMIKQKSRDCYVETPDGNKHMSCDEARKQGTQ